MSVARSALLIVFCVQGLVKFAVGFLVHARDHRPAHRPHGPNAHHRDLLPPRLSQPLLADQAPESSSPPRKILSYAIKANAGLAWREIALMAMLFAWTHFALVVALED